MKKMIWAACFAATAVLTAQAQNVQLHYDLGHSLYSELGSRPNVTTTIEMFRPDRWGSNYFFADIDYFSDGAAGAYWEVSRELNLTANRQWALHLEYNGGATSVEHTAIASRFQHAFLGGGAWNWLSHDGNRSFSLQAMYKYYFKGQAGGAFSGFQTTAVWGNTFAHGLMTFSGFCDLWYHPDVAGKLILLSEPQLWVNLGALPAWKDINLSVGTEVELSNNFVYDNRGRNNRLYAIPTLAAKWTF